MRDRLFSSYDDRQGALRALQPLGFDPQHIEIFAGAEGAELLDLCGQRHGVATWMVRNIGALVSDDASLLQQADVSITRGRWGIAVLMDDKDSIKEQVAAVLNANHTQMVHDWGRLTTERLG